MIPALPGSGRSLRRLVTPRLQRAAATPGADRYRKHFPATAHLWILLIHGLLASPSLRATYALLSGLDRLPALGLRQGLSFSQLARSSTSRPSACVEGLFDDLVRQAHRQVIPDVHWRLLRKVQAFDSTFLRLSGKLSPWSQHGGATPGLRVQTAFDVSRALPTRLWLTRTATNDHDALAEADLTPWRGWTVLLDLGYYGHRQFQRLQAAQVSFVSRLQPQAVWQVTATRSVPVKPTPEGDLVLSDETITLGSPTNRRGAVLPGLRLVRSRNRHGEEHAFVTDRFDLTAAEIVRLYRLRWRIELFFRFLKCQLGLLPLLGRSEAAVWLSVLVAAIVAILLLLLTAERPAGASREAWAHLLGLALLIAGVGS